MSIDSDAFSVVSSLPGLSPEERQYVMTIARGEGFYGLGWGTPKAATRAKAEELGIDPLAGIGSHNWGAIQGTGPAGSFPHVDHRADGTPYIGQFRKYNTDQEGAADLARVLLKANVRQALSRGSLREAVFAQHANRYFELAPEKYLSSVMRNYDAITQRLEWPILLSEAAQTAEPLSWLPIIGLSALIFYGTLSLK